MLQVRDIHKSPRGTFSISQKNYYQHLRCEYVLQGASLYSTVSHANKEDKTVAIFAWTAPPVCEEKSYDVV